MTRTVPMQPIDTDHPVARAGAARMAVPVVLASGVLAIGIGCAGAGRPSPSPAGAPAPPAAASVIPSTTHPTSASQPTATPQGRGAASQASGTARPRGIRDVDFGAATVTVHSSATWTIRLDAGRGTVGGNSTATLDPRRTQVVDIDGDGNPDAITLLRLDLRSGALHSFQVWRWDSGARRAVQALPAISSEPPCGDIVESVSAQGNGILTATVSEIDAYASGVCRSIPRVTTTRQLRLEGGFLYQSAPSPSALGCGIVLGSGMAFGAPMGDGRIRALPDPAAPVLALAGETDYATHHPDQGNVPAGWARVVFIWTDADKGVRPPCGYVRL